MAGKSAPPPPRPRPLESIAGTGWRVREATDPAEILGILERDATYAFYAIGDLDPRLVGRSRWFVAEDHGRPASLALLFTGLQTPALFLFGEGQGIVLILAAALRPVRAFATFLESHRTSLEAYYRLGEVEPMLRMTYERPRHVLSVSPLVSRLTIEDLNDLLLLYQLQPGSVFVADQLREGVYYGARINGALVAAAGTHLVSRAYGRAAVGNVFTHPAHRGRGYATACTEAVLCDLTRNVPNIALNVGAGNQAAIHIYERLGFVVKMPFSEAPVIRRGARSARQ